MTRIRALVLIVVVGVVLTVPTSLALAASTTAALWHMDEPTGTTMIDASGHGNNGVLKHVTPGVAGIGGSKAYGFDGRSSVVLVPDAPSLDPGAADLVVTVHVAFTTVPADDYDVIRKGLSSTQGGDWKIEIVNVNGLAIARCYLRGSAAAWQKTAGPSLADGAWHTITCEKHATSVVLSVDGRIWKTTRSVGTIANTAQLSIGAKAEGGDWYRGSIDEVSVVTGS